MEVQVPVQEFNDGLTPYQFEVLKDFDNGETRFFMLNWHRRARKTTLAINLLIREAVKNSQSRFGYITSTYKAAKNIVWRDPNMLKRYLPMGLVKKFNESELYVEFINGSILSLHGSDEPDSLKGLDFKGIVLDEWSLCKRDAWDELLLPIIRQAKNRWAVFIFTPKGFNHAHEMWIDAKLNKDWKTYELKASQSGLIPFEELEKAKRELTNKNLYQQEYECSFIAGDENQVFNGEDLIRCVDRTVPIINEVRKLTVCDVASEGGDETVIYNLENTKKVSEQIYVHKDLMDTVGRIMAEVKRHGSNYVIVDKIGEGSGVFSRLREVYENDGSISVIGYDGRLEAVDKETYANKRVEDAFKVARMVTELKVDLPDDPVLVKQLMAIRFKYSSNGRLILEKKEIIKSESGVGQDRSDALIMALASLERVSPVKKLDRYKNEDLSFVGSAALV